MIVSDYHMPAPTVHDLLGVVTTTHPSVRRVLLTAAPEEDYTPLLRLGLVHAVLRKTFDPPHEMISTITAAATRDATVIEAYADCRRKIEEARARLEVAARHFESSVGVLEGERWTAARHEAAHHLRASARIQRELAAELERVAIERCAACAGRGCAECRDRGQLIRIRPEQGDK